MKIRVKMVAVFTSILIITIVILGISSYNLVHKNLLMTVRNDLDSYVEQFYVVLEANPDMDWSVIENLCNKKITIGKQGFIFVIDTHGNLIFHRKKQGENWKDKPHIKEILEKKNGRIRYLSPVTHTYKIASFKYIKSYEWIVVASAFEDDFLAKPRADAIKSVVMIGIIIAVVGGLLIFFFANALSKGIYQLVSAVKKVAKGELSARANIKSSDEIGILANNFNFMAESLQNQQRLLKESKEDLEKGAQELFKGVEETGKGNLTFKVNVNISKDETLQKIMQGFNDLISKIRDIVLGIRASAEKVFNSAQNLSSTTQEMNASSQEVAGAMNQITQGVTTQTQKIEEASRTMEQMAASLKQVKEGAENAAVSLNQSSNQVNASGKKMAEMSDKMGIISETVNEAAELMRVLGGRSQEIGEITTTITNIADQTNLLSLNAAIEAARAGEAGRGFAVVAEEVRKLAENSGQAASHIGSLIRNIQAEVSKAISAIETGSKEVVEGKKVSAEVNKTLKEVIGLVDKAADMAKDIVISIDSQLGSTEKVVSAVNKVASVAEETSASVEETSSSVEEQTASIEEMSSSAQQLAQLAEDMKNLMAKFKA